LIFETIKKRFLKKNSCAFCQGLTLANLLSDFDLISEKWVRTVCTRQNVPYAICQELNPWQGHLRWADLLVILLMAKLLANVHLTRLFAFCQGFCPWLITIFLVVLVHILYFEF